MGITHHDSMTLAGALVVAGTVSQSGAFTASASGKQTALTKLNVSGTTRVSGIFSASAANKQTTLTKLAVSGTAVISGAVQATGSGKTSTIGVLSVTGKSTLAQLVVSSAANAWCGKRVLGTAGTATQKFSIGTTKVLSSSRIFLSAQPSAGSVGGAKASRPVVATIASGSSFSVRLLYGLTPTGATGTMHWNIINVT